jgi:hypothetical protein
MPQANPAVHRFHLKTKLIEGDSRDVTAEIERERATEKAWK